jgi:hypothetical protein
MLALSLLVLSAASGALSSALAPRASAVPTDYYLPPYFCPAMADATVSYVDYASPLANTYNTLTCGYTDSKRCHFDLVCPAPRAPCRKRV